MSCSHQFTISTLYVKLIDLLNLRKVKDYALINRVRGPYEETFVLTFKVYGPNAVTNQSEQRIRSVFQLVYYNVKYSNEEVRLKFFIDAFLRNTLPIV